MSFARVLSLSLGLTVLLTSLAPSDSTVKAAAQKADILVIMVDDLAYLPDETLLKRLPNTRKHFLTNGKRFNHIYNETPLCCPAQANFWSAQHTFTNGVYSNDPTGFDHSKTLNKALHEAGYETIFVGKYLLNYDGAVVPPGIHRALMRRSHKDPRFWRNGDGVEFPGQHIDQVTKSVAVEWLRDAPLDKPVFEFVSPKAPHITGFGVPGCDSRLCQYQPTVIDADQGSRFCKGVGVFKPPTYYVNRQRQELPLRMPNWPAGWPLTKPCESLLVVDRLVGQLVAEQKKRGRPAYFIFMSDNGMSWGQKGQPIKYVPTSTRLPFYVNGPGVSRKNSNKLLSIIDVAPTIADIAGAEMPWAQGVSFLPILEGQSFAGNKVHLELQHRMPGDKFLGWTGTRDKRWFYYRRNSGKRELYEYRRDQWLERNLAKQRPRLVRWLNTRLDLLVRESKTHPKFD